jgi:hypothetical protein
VPKDFWGDIFLVEDGCIEILVDAGDVDLRWARQAMSTVEAVAPEISIYACESMGVILFRIGQAKVTHGFLYLRARLAA